MSIAIAALLFLAPANDDHDLDLAAALARRGWIELAEELCTRIEKSPSASPAARAGVPMVLAEVAIAKARVDADVLNASKELEAAVLRLNRPNHAPSLDERGMIGWLHVQKAKLLSGAAETDAARRPDALKAWETVETYYRSSEAELEKMPSSRPVDEALLDARLEIPKSMAARARVPSIDPTLRKKLLEGSLQGFSSFQLLISLQPILLEARLEEGRSLADLQDYVRAERCFRDLSRIQRDLAKQGYRSGDYQTSLLQEGTLQLVRTLTLAKKGKDAVAACDEFFRANARLVRSAFGFALTLAKAEALYSLGDSDGAIALAETVDTPAARQKVLEWAAGKPVTPERAMKRADGLMDQNKFRDALVELRRCAEACVTAADRAKYEPAAAFKRGECFRSLRQDAEAAAAWQEVFRKYPKHELAPRAGLEAVRSLVRISASSGDKRDQAQVEATLDEVEKLGLEGEAAPWLRFIRAEILEGRGQFKAAADLFRQVDESCPVHEDALVSGGHCYRRDAEQKWERARGAATVRDDVVKQLALAESMLLKALPRLEAGGRDKLKLLVFATYELAAIDLHELVGKTKEALTFLEKCGKLLPAESEMRPRLAELEILAHLSAKDLPSAAAGVDRMLNAFPDSVATARSCRKVAQRYESTDLGKAATYYSAWLDRSATIAVSTAELQIVADGLYRAARALNGLDDRVVSVVDLKGKAVADRTSWRGAARANEMLLLARDLGEKDALVASNRLACCLGFAADSAAEWTKSKNHGEKVIQDHQLLKKDGSINLEVLQAKKWLAGSYLEYGHSLFQLGRAGQKFQYSNGITVFNNLTGVTEPGSEPWWTVRYLDIRSRFERGEADDVKTAAALLSNVERNRPGFDEGKFGMKDRFLELRAQIQAVTGPQR